MGINIPSNLIVSKYTNGGEFIYVTTYQDYQGHYYEFSGKKYAGKEFSINALEIIEKSSDKISSLLKTNNPLLSIYGILSKVNLNGISNVHSIPNGNSRTAIDTQSDDPSNNTLSLSFYCRKINEKEIKIKEIDEKTYKSIQSNPLYQATYVGFYNNKTQFLDDAEMQLPGLKSFLS